jgi:hypothetical protein
MTASLENQRKRRVDRHRTTRFVVIASLASTALACAAGCSLSSNEKEGKSAGALIGGGDILGFESTDGWTVSSGTVSTTTTRTQGAQALAVAGPNDPTLTSANIDSSASALAALTNANSTVAVDLLLPTTQADPNDVGSLQLFVSAPAEGVDTELLDTVNLNGQTLGVFQTYQFAVPDDLRSALSGQAYSDLTFTIALTNPPRNTGTYIFDNLRAMSPATQPVGPGPSIDLQSKGDQPTGPRNPLDSATFAPGTIQIPASIHVAISAPETQAVLNLGWSLRDLPTRCTYIPSADNTSYQFSSCSTGNVAGDLVPASAAQLIQTVGSPNVVKVQLAYNALGDQVGTGLLPPLPTFWGNSLTDANTIASAFFQAIQNPSPAPAQASAITMPIPAFALRVGDGSPVDTTNGLPPPPNDPPFHWGGQLGGSFVGVQWGLDGNLSFDPTNNDFKTHFDSDASIKGSLAWNNFDLAHVKLTTDTNTGQVSAGGFAGPGASGDFTVIVLGKTIRDDKLNQGNNALFNPNLDQEQTLFSFSLWIFNINAGLHYTLGVTGNVNLASSGPTISVTPHGTVEAHLSGSIGIPGFLGGGVEGRVQLADIALPLSATANWTLVSDPGTCAANLSYDVNGRLQLSSLGGEIDGTWNAIFWSGSQAIIKWNPVATIDKVLFDVNSPAPSTGLPASLCTVPLNVTIQSPSPGTTFTAGLPGGASVTGGRPATVGQGPLSVATADTCPSGSPISGNVTWTSSDPKFAQQTGCTPNLTFGTPGQQTLTATIVDQYGETGTATVTVNVVSPPVGPAVSIVSPTSRSVFVCSGTAFDAILFEIAINLDLSTINHNFLVQWNDGNGNVIYSQTITNPSATNFLLTPTIDVPLGLQSVVSVTVTDMNNGMVSPAASVSLNVQGNQ